MLFTLVITHLFALAATNPFHKYPYVFLLDVGNEEIQNTNSEQIRVSIPGGSLALRYPGIGDGDTIAHVRVSGIDFGTDLKVNIVDGGPGSKYAVIVFMGNPGVAYDAVVTIQTVPDDTAGFNAQDIDLTNDIADNIKEVSEEDNNNSAEESDNSESDVNNQQSKSELTQASSNYYNYANNEINVNDDSENDAANEESDNNNESGIEEQHAELANEPNNNDDDGDEIQEQHNQKSNQAVEAIDYDENNDDANEDNDENDENVQEEYNVKNGYVANEYYNREESAGVVGNLYYDRLNIVRPYLYNGARMYPDQGAQYNDESDVKSSYDADVESDQAYRNDEIHEVSKDSNNNLYASDDSSPVES